MIYGNGDDDCYYNYNFCYYYYIIMVLCGDGIYENDDGFVI